MTDGYVLYSTGYRWQLREDACFQTGILGYEIHHDYICLEPGGKLLIKRGYATDGITGITGTPWACLLERQWLKRGSFAHDAVYQLIRLQLLPKAVKVDADILLREICLDDGSYQWQADLVHSIVGKHGGSAILPSAERPVLAAP